MMTSINTCSQPAPYSARGLSGSRDVCPPLCFCVTDYLQQTAQRTVGHEKKHSAKSSKSHCQDKLTNVSILFLTNIPSLKAFIALSQYRGPGVLFGIPIPDLKDRHSTPSSGTARDNEVDGGKIQECFQCHFGKSVTFPTTHGNPNP